MTYYTAFLLVRGTGELQLDKFTDELMAALIVREDEFVDPGLGVQLKTGLIEFSFGLAQGNPYLPVNRLFGETRFKGVEVLGIHRDDDLEANPAIYKKVEQYK